MNMTKEQFQAYYTDAKVDQLRAAFEFIQNKEHWKNPIDAWISPFMFDLCAEACVFYTTTALKKTGETRTNFYGNNEVRVKADGYYLSEAN
jgi:hypothetical protein